MTLNRNDILNALDLPVDEVDVPRWGGAVLVRAMAMGSPRYEIFVEKGGTPKNPISNDERMKRRYVGAVILCALDGDTEERMFEWSDANQIREKHWNSVLKVATRAFELAGSDDTDDDEDDAPLDLEPEDIITDIQAAPETAEDAPDPPKED